MNTRVQFILAICLLGLLCLMLPSSVRADTFTYISNPYTDCYGNYCSDGPLTIPGTVLDGSGAYVGPAMIAANSETLAFTTTLTGSALDNLTAYGIPLADISSFSFTDTAGLSITQANLTDPDNVGTYFIISTDANGNITAWNITATFRSNPTGAGTVQQFYSVYNDGGPFDTNEDASTNCTSIGTACAPPNGGFGYNKSDQSTWTDLTTTNTPEPSSFLLLGTGLFALVVIGWRRISQASGSLLS